MPTQTLDIQSRDKQEIRSASEQTTPGRVSSPRVDIFEDDQALTIVADMPGVQSDDVNIDLHEDVLTLTGVPSVFIPEKKGYILQEFDAGKYLRRFTLSEVIDQTKIKAKLDQGVLRVILPKVSGPGQAPKDSNHGRLK